MTLYGGYELLVLLREIELEPGSCLDAYVGSIGTPIHTYDEFAAGVTKDEDPTGRAASSEFAVVYGKTVNHHASDTIPRKYRSEISLRREAEAAQRILAVRALRLGPPEEEDET